MVMPLLHLNKQMASIMLDCISQKSMLDEVLRWKQLKPAISWILSYIMDVSAQYAGQWPHTPDLK